MIKEKVNEYFEKFNDLIEFMSLLLALKVLNDFGLEMNPITKFVIPINVLMLLWLFE